MITRFSIKNWRLLVWLLGPLLFLVFARLVFAQESPENIARKYGITFPIAELGGCANLAECRTFCEDPAHFETCVTFAKKKGFHKEEKIEKRAEQQGDFWEKTSSELGCDSEPSCRAVCEQEANFEKCAAFARRHSISGGHAQNPAKSEIVEQAKEVLGCDSYASCKSFCEQEVNRQKCSEFARQVGLRGGEHMAGPGGCTSEETCRAFCSDPQNFQVCSGFSSSSGGRFTGPGGCNNEQSCRAYCQAHPQECGYQGGREGGKNYDPVEMCNKTPQCKWANDTCQCGFYGEGEGDIQKRKEEYERFCRENPEKCGSFGRPSQCPEGHYMGPGGVCTPLGQSQEALRCHQAGKFWDGNICRDVPPPGGGSSSTGGYGGDPARECAKYGCSWVNNSCQCQGTYKQSDPATECTKYGCTWTGSTCQCAGTSSTGTTVPPSTGGTYPSYDPATECAKSPGCSWTGSTCQCGGNTSGGTTTQSSGGTSSYDPATECAKQSGCSWTGSSCQCSSTGGSSPPPSEQSSSPPPSTGGSVSQPDPATECVKQAGCSWTGSTCQCGGVQGVTTYRSLLQVIWEFLF